VSNDSNSFLQQLVKQQFLARGVHHLRYMAPLPTMCFIAGLGILSYNARKQLEYNDMFANTAEVIGSKSIADPLVQFRRDRYQVFGRNLHDYVPLYIGIHTPMQYVVTRDNFDQQEFMIAFAEVSTEKVFDIEGVCYTDGNASSSRSRVYSGIDGINAIKWHIALHESKCWSRDYKFYKCAEVLVPDRVPQNCIDRYVFMTKRAADTFCQMINNMISAGIITYTDFEIVYDDTYFYSKHGGRLEPNG
jgi:hypothetical protein